MLLEQRQQKDVHDRSAMIVDAIEFPLTIRSIIYGYCKGANAWAKYGGGSEIPVHVKEIIISYFC